jgi:8-oxo-dGTP pyrophosphatase MutT (NUDIX family)
MGLPSFEGANQSKMATTPKPEEQTESPWKTLNSESRYENPWINVRHEDVVNPSGGIGIYGVVSFKNMALGVVPVDENYYTYLVGQYRYTLNSYSWEIPEGGGPFGIPPLESIKRELLEETGLVAAKWTNLGLIHTSNSVTDEYGYIYMAQELTKGEAQPEATEDLRIWHLPLTEAIAMCMRGEITDGLSLAGLLKAGRLLEL